MENLILFILAYISGSIPFGLILAKKFANVDIKQSGSKSIGATNVLRVVKEKDPILAKKLSIATVILDAIKGTIILLIALIVGANESTLWGMAILSVVGHCYSIFLKGEGGKGVATGLGVLIVLVPVASLIGVVVWAISAKVLKISSLSSLFGLLGIVISATIINDGLNVGSNMPIYILAFIIFYKHIPNLIRLIQGKETKVV
jgi:glycerol-3-phosphate acyltransferase PlsY